MSKNSASPKAVTAVSVKSVALDYINRGWAPIPIPYRAKAPRDGWENLQLSAADVDAQFPAGLMNIGVRLGSPSGGLVDVDCDWPEAVALAPYFLPLTSTFGRPGKPKSHYLYQCSPPPEQTRQWAFGAENVVELRSTGGQTVFPPSVHPSNEPITWTSGDPQPAPCDAADLAQAVTLIATAAVLVRHWPRHAGRRDELAMACAGMLLRYDLTPEQAAKIIQLVARHAGDEEADAREAKVQRTARKLSAGQFVT